MTKTIKDCDTNNIAQMLVELWGVANECIELETSGGITRGYLTEFDIQDAERWLENYLTKALEAKKWHT